MSEGHAVDVGIIAADERSAAFFEAAARGVLLIKRCGRCGRWLDPAAAGCPGCGADDPGWEPAAGHGTLISWAVLHAGEPGPAAAAEAADAAEAASVLALVELDEGPWLRSRLEGTGGAGQAAPRAGMAVTAAFVHPAEGASYPVFRPAE